MEVILSLIIFGIVCTAFTKGLSSLWRNTSFIKEELTITQILDSALYEALYISTLVEGTSEVYVAELDITLEVEITPLELENEEGAILQQMWEAKVVARFEQNNREEERSVRGWRYLPLYNTR